MSASGPITNFTDAEKQEFMPIYTKYIQKQVGPREILTALGGDKEKYKRFQGYASLMTTVLKHKQSERKTEALEERRDMLVKQVADREATIAASRQKTAAEALKYTPAVRVTPSLKS